LNRIAHTYVGSWNRNKYIVRPAATPDAMLSVRLFIVSRSGRGFVARIATKNYQQSRIVRKLFAGFFRMVRSPRTNIKKFIEQWKSFFQKNYVPSPGVNVEMPSEQTGVVTRDA